MSPLFDLVVVMAALGAGLVAWLTRRVHDEIDPTVRAFAEFRAALTPSVVELRSEQHLVRARIERLTRPEIGAPQG